MAKPKLAMYWAASCGGCEIAVLNIAEKILDVDANFRRGVLAGGDGRQVQGRRGDGRRRDHAVPVQRRHSQRRERAPRQTAAPEIGGARRIWLVRERRLHPRPGQSHVGPGGHRDGVQHGLDRQSRQRSPGLRLCGAGRRAAHPPDVRDPEDARPGRAGGLPHARLPAGIQPDRGGDRRW